MEWVYGLMSFGAALIIPGIVLIVVVRHGRELRRLRERIETLERRPFRVDEQPLTLHPAEPLPDIPAVTPMVLPVPPAAPARDANPARAAAGGRGFDSSRAEELVGSVWLQNIGAVLLLLGVFFLILWGYTNGRIGPEVLVAAGVALGGTVMWRGDRVARRLPPFGHALIGVGLGVAYLSLYLGHYTLHVLPSWAAFTLLALLSVAAIAVGRHYGVQTIAELGVLGAFMPQLMAAWIPMRALQMSPTSLLGYMALIDAVVFVLAARAGWSSLSVAAMLLTAVTWVSGTRITTWSWGMEGALAALFTALGLSPVPRFTRRPDPLPAVDLAVVALAPLALIACSWPMLESAGRMPVAILALTLAIVYLAVALWVDAQRPTQDLWRPLTGAAVVFITAAIERTLGEVHTPMGWCIEGTLLLWIGLRPRGGWLRLCGSLVTMIGVVAMLVSLFDSGDWKVGDWPVFYGAGIRDLVCVIAVLIGAGLIGRARDTLGAAERALGHLWTATGNLLLAVWILREAGHVAQSFASPGGRWYGAAPSSAAQRLIGLTFALTGTAWLVHAGVLIETGLRRGGAFMRGSGYVLALIATFTLFLGTQFPDGWSIDQLPVLHAVGLLRLAGVVMLYVFAARLARRRSGFAMNERGMPEVWAVVASVTLMAWTGAEAEHLARYTQGVPGRWAMLGAPVTREVMAHVMILTSVITSAGWLAEAVVLLVTGWVRASAFLRWMGLGLIGLTVLKFLLFDLQTVDIFWRFLTALVVGAALLAVSYAYQRRTREEKLRKSA